MLAGYLPVLRLGRHPFGEFLAAVNLQCVLVI